MLIFTLISPSEQNEVDSVACICQRQKIWTLLLVSFSIPRFPDSDADSGANPSYPPLPRSIIFQILNVSYFSPPPAPYF